MANDGAATASGVEDGLPPVQRRWVILTLATGLVLSVPDSTIVNIALPAIAHELNAEPSAAIWVVNAYRVQPAVAGVPPWPTVKSGVGWRSARRGEQR